MSLGKKLFHQDAAAATGDANAAQGLVLHLDPNDEDSIEAGGANVGDGSGTWFDISGHNLDVPLVDKASNLQLHLNASNTTSYGGSGNDWTDISQNSNTATDTSPTFSSDTRGYFVMDGSNDLFTINYDASLYMTSNTGFAIEAWVNRDSNSEMYIIASDDGSSFPFALQWLSATHGYYGWISGSSVSGAIGLSENSTNGIGEWDHVVITQSSSDRKNRLYVNGTLVGTSSAVTGFHSTSSGVNIGAYWNETGKFDGKISVIRIYNSELTASEVAQNFRADCFLSYSSIYDTSIRFNLEANNYTSGAWVDTQGNHNATIVVDGSNAVFDKELNNFFTLDASGTYGDHIEIATNSLFNMTADCSWEFMFRRDSTTNEQQIAYVGSGITYGSAGSNTRWFLNYATQSGYGFYFYNYDTQSLVTSGNINSNNLVNEFEHVIVTWDVSEKKLQLYYNGILTENLNTVGSGTVGTHSATTEPLYLGRANGYSAQPSLVGAFAVARFHTSTLTAAQAAQNYLATKNDYPNGYNATITGAELGDTSGSNPKFFNFNAKTEQIVIDASTHNGALQPSINTDMTYLVWVYFLGSATTTYALAADGSYILSGRGSGYSFYYRYYTSKLQLAIYDDSANRDILENDLGSISSSTWYLLGFRTTTAGAARHHRITTGSSTFTDASGTMSDYETTAEDFNIGHYQTNYGFKGYIGAVQVYQRYLSDSEITAYYDANKATYNLS